MADKLMGRLIQPFSYIGIRGYLAHEHEKGDYREAVGGEGVKKIFDQKIAGRAEVDQIGEPHKTHDSHGKGQFNPGKKNKSSKNRAAMPVVNSLIFFPHGKVSTDR